MARRKEHSDSGLFYVWLYAFAFAGVIVLAFTVSVEARPAESWTSPVCFTPAIVKQAAGKIMKTAPIMVERKGDMAKALIEKLNQTGRPTSYNGDHLIYWTAPYKPPFQIVIFKHGCAVVQCIYNRGCMTLAEVIAKRRKDIPV